MSLLTPKGRKYRKEHVREVTGKTTRGTVVSFGELGLKATTSWYVTSRQLEAARKVIVRHIKKVGKIWMRVFPSVPMTKKWLELPMGSGKGDVEQYAARVKAGRVLFEVSGLDPTLANQILLSACKKLPVQWRVVAKGEVR